MHKYILTDATYLTTTNYESIQSSQCNVIIRFGVPSSSVFLITCFYLNFNGEQIGPIHCEKEITPFDGTRDIFNLPFFPIEYADFHDHQYAENENDDAPKPEKAVKVLLQERGERFAKLVSSKEVAHMEYSGCVVRHNTPL